MGLLFFIIFCGFLSASDEQCESYFKKIEQENNIPEDVLKAIAYAESGQKITPNKIVAWPWTINLKGKGYIFETKQKAVAAARFIIQQGYNNFDIGCMQVNLKYHPNAFKSLEEGFSPEKNVAYAATFLTKLKNENKHWKKAIAHYHNAQEKFNQPYQKRVLLYKSKIQKNLFKNIEENFSTSYLKKSFTESDLIFFSNIERTLTPQNLVNCNTLKTVIKPVIHIFSITQPSKKTLKHIGKKNSILEKSNLSSISQEVFKKKTNTIKIKTTRYVNGEIKTQNVTQTEIKTPHYAP